MSVQQLIDRLQSLPDKSATVLVPKTDKDGTREVPLDEVGPYGYDVLLRAE